MFEVLFIHDSSPKLPYHFGKLNEITSVSYNIIFNLGWKKKGENIHDILKRE
jgi:hypothetical protein